MKKPIDRKSDPLWHVCFEKHYSDSDSIIDVVKRTDATYEYIMGLQSEEDFKYKEYVDSFKER